MASIPFAFIYVLNNGNPYERYLANKYIPSHLEDMGYGEEDILKQLYIETKHSINNNVYHGHYKVIFKDEPQLEYLYGVTKNGKNVVQFCEKETLITSNTYAEMTTEKTIHSEQECIGYLDNR
ncbi:DUF3139 domain-containing protein [Bacillus sp. YZJH907-2]|uniref:DUF3139 domain-containing protein n=2 Tax=Halalkalibacter suaedae TaxID=2822140 RepID=A0A940WQ17_9BACI|nr:DUF3139 domain-containing protein [Bacillus suaedae]